MSDESFLSITLVSEGREEKKALKAIKRDQWVDEAIDRTVRVEPIERNTFPLGSGFIQDGDVVILNIDQIADWDGVLHTLPSRPKFVEVVFSEREKPVMALVGGTNSPFPQEISRYKLSMPRFTPPATFGGASTEGELAYVIGNEGVQGIAKIVSCDFSIEAYYDRSLYSQINRGTRSYGTSVYNSNGQLLGLVIGNLINEPSVMVLLPSLLINHCLYGDSHEIRGLSDLKIGMASSER